MFETKVVSLPSRGLLYPEGEASVEIRNMTLAEEKIMVSNMSASEKIKAIVSACLIKKLAFPPGDLLIADEMFLLFAIRALSFGPDFIFKTMCPQCDAPIVETLHIPDSFEIKYAPDDLQEPFFVSLVKEKKKLGLRYLRVKDQRDIERRVARQKSMALDVNDEGYVFRMAKQVVSIDGKETMLPLVEQILEKLHSADSLLLQSKIEEHEFGIPLSRVLDCPSCGMADEHFLRLTAEFFRPRTKSRGL